MNLPRLMMLINIQSKQVFIFICQFCFIGLLIDYKYIKAEEAAKAGISPIIIDNTNIRIWEFKDYVKIALKYEYHIEIMEPG